MSGNKKSQKTVHLKPTIFTSTSVIINNSKIGLRSGATGKLNEVCGSNNLKACYINDGAKAWNKTKNKTPSAIKNSKSLYSAKIEIKKFVKTLPV